MVTVIPRAGLAYPIDGYLKQVLDGFKDAIKYKNTSVVIVIDGRSGMGKTTLMNQILTYLDPTYTLDNIHFDPESFLRGLNVPPEKAVSFDEAMLLSNRSVLSRMNRMVIKAMSEIRSKRIFVGICINSIFDLDKNLALSRADLLLHVYGDNLIDRGNFAAFFKPSGAEDRIKQLFIFGKKYYTYSRPKANFFGKFSPKFTIDEEEYEKKKQESINKYLRGDENYYGKAYHSRNNLIRYLHIQCGINVKEIAKISNLSEMQVYNILEDKDKDKLTF